MFEIIKKLSHTQINFLMNYAKALREKGVGAEGKINAKASINAYCACLRHCAVLTLEESSTLCSFLSNAEDEEFAWLVKFMD